MSGKKPVSREPRDLSGLLKDLPAGAWVALSKDKTRVVGVANTAGAATYHAQLNGENSPVLIRMPIGEEGIAAGVR